LVGAARNAYVVPAAEGERPEPESVGLAMALAALQPTDIVTVWTGRDS
jgi:hypothetical protein